MRIPVVEQVLNELMFRVVGLQYHFTRFMFSPGTPGDLGIQLPQALCCTKVGTVKRAVDIQQSDQSNIGKMVPFRQHLRAHQKRVLVISRFLQVFVQLTFATCRVPVNTQHTTPREHFF